MNFFHSPPKARLAHILHLTFNMAGYGVMLLHEFTNLLQRFNGKIIIIQSEIKNFNELLCPFLNKT